MEFLPTRLRAISFALLLTACSYAPSAKAQDPYLPYLGFYSIAGDPKPTAFPEFDNFVFTEFNDKGLKGRVVPPSGKVREFATASLRSGELKFMTLRVNGISYSFSGEFLAVPPKPVDGKTPVLEGTLKRFKNGIVTASAKLKFAISEGGGE